MLEKPSIRYLIASILFHVIFLLGLVMGFDVSIPLPVFENTNKHDVISAIVLGDSPKSKILPHTVFKPPASEIKQEKKPEIFSKPKLEEAVEKDMIALKLEEKKKKAELERIKLMETKKQQQKLFAKDLLADIKKQSEKQAEKSKKVQSEKNFEKTLREQAEKSLRQQLIDEDIHLQNKQFRQAQGEINKYKALILQAISEHWIIPSQADKSLYCELMIRLAPGGKVLEVRITKGSGDLSLDRSARTAVLKASPLPVPSNAQAFEPFREFVLKVKPENILAGDN